jgi:2-methylcitrate dehydratase PrpD
MTTTPTHEMALADVLAKFASEFDLDRTAAGDDLLEKAKLHLLDGIGIAFASTQAEDGYAQALMRMVRSYGSSEQATVIGFGDRVATPLAALANGALIHGCEFDDTYYERTVHTEAFAVPATLALAERGGRTGAELAEAWIVATEVGLRLACGCNREENLYDTGFHTSAIFGTFGAAAGAARLLGLEADDFAGALALCVSFASGTAAGWDYASGRNKSIQPGWASMSGTMAALAAAEGYTCAHDTLEADNGLYASHAWRSGWSPEGIVGGLGESWKLLDLAFKVYPAGAMVQAAIDCVRELVYEHDILPDEVQSVEVVVPSQFAGVLEGLIDGSYRPASGYTQFSSWPCNVARMILSRRVGLQHLTDAAVSEPALLSLADRVICTASRDTGGLAADRPTSVAIVTARGRFERSRGKHSGHPEHTSRNTIVAKFHGNAELVVPHERAEQIVAMVLDLEALGDVRELTKLLGP